MQNSSRRLRRSLPRGGRLALVVPTALLAITAMVSPSFAEDVTADDPAGNPPAAETPTPDPAPQPEPDPEPEPAPEPKPDPAPVQAEQAEQAEQKSAPTPGAAFADAKVVEEAETKAADDAPVQAVKPDKDKDKDDEKKVVVCRYVGTPPGELDHIVVTGKSSVKGDWDEETFPWAFADAQISLAVRFAIGNEQPEDLELECPQRLLAVPDVPVLDDCGPGNALYGAVPPSDNYTIVRNPGGSITLVADTGYDFPGGADEYVFDAPVDTNEPCDEPAEIAAPELLPEDPCGVGNAAYPVVPDGPYEVKRHDDGSITLTALGEATFAGGEPTYTYPVPMEINTEECVNEKKVVACKWVTTPGGEVDHIIVVGVSALGKDWDGEFPAPFADAQDSIAFRYAKDGEEKEDVSLAECFDEEEPAEIDIPELTFSDPCGVDNASYDEVPPSEDYEIAHNVDGSITLNVLGEVTFPGGKLSHTYPALVEENTEACSEVDDTRVVLCTYSDVARARATSLLGTILILDLADLLAEGFAGDFPFDFGDEDSYSIAIRYAFEGENAENIDATVCGVDSESDEDVPGEVGGLEEVAASAGVLPNTGGPAGWLVPLGAGLVLAGAALAMARRPRTA